MAIGVGSAVCGYQTPQPKRHNSVRRTLRRGRQAWSRRADVPLPDTNNAAALVTEVKWRVAR